MPHYYRGPRVHVSHRVFETWGPAYRVYAIEDLADAWTVKRRKGRRRGAIRRTCSRGAVGTVVLALVHGLLPSRDDELIAAVLIILASVVAVGVAAVAYSRRRWVYELWGSYRGVPVRLVVSRDLTSFNQICRALQRALEWQRDAES